MNKSTTSLIFPDVNIWMALTLEHHVHRPIARAWWAQADARIAFLRFTEIGFLRLLTTHAAMDGKPVSVDDAWGLDPNVLQEMVLDLMSQLDREFTERNKIEALLSPIHSLKFCPA